MNLWFVNNSWQQRFQVVNHMLLTTANAVTPLTNQPNFEDFQLPIYLQWFHLRIENLREKKKNGGKEHNGSGSGRFGVGRTNIRGGKRILQRTHGFNS